MRVLHHLILSHTLFDIEIQSFRNMKILISTVLGTLEDGRLLRFYKYWKELQLLSNNIIKTQRLAAAFWTAP